MRQNRHAFIFFLLCILATSWLAGCAKPDSPGRMASTDRNVPLAAPTPTPATGITNVPVTPTSEPASPTPMPISATHTLTATSEPPTPFSSWTPSPLPLPITSLPTINWNSNLEHIASFDQPIVWSPVENKIVFTSCYPLDELVINPLTISIAEEPSFEPEMNKFENFSCPLHQSSPIPLWSLDGKQIFFGSIPASLDLGSHEIAFISTIDSEGKNFRSTEIAERYLHFSGWMDNETLVFEGYTGGGNWYVFLLDITTNEQLAWALIHAAKVETVDQTFVLTNSGADQDFNYSAAIISRDKISSNLPERFDGPFLDFLSFSRNGIALKNEFNSRFEDWIHSTNQMLVLTWDTDVSLSNIDLPYDEPVTDLKIWDVENDTLTLIIPGGVSGKFSENGRFLAFLTPTSPHPFLQLLDRNSGEIIFAIQSSTKTYNYYSSSLAHYNFSPNSGYLAFYTPGKIELYVDSEHLELALEQAIHLNIFNLETFELLGSFPAINEPVVWGPNSTRVIFRDKQQNLVILDVENGRSTPITTSGGSRLSNPQWSFDGAYLSFTVENEAGWETAVLKTP